MSTDPLSPSPSPSPSSDSNSNDANTTTTIPSTLANTNPWLTESYWKQYFDSLARNTTELVKRIAEKGVYEFEYVEGDRKGEKVQYQRGKISVKQMRDLETMRAQYAKLNSQNSTVNEAASMLINIYAKVAQYYFGIPEPEFANMDWDASKLNCDAAVHISTYGRPK